MKTINFFIVILFCFFHLNSYGTTYYFRAAGNWSDPNSWSTSSAALVISGTEPGAGDDVIIDGSSPIGTLTVTSGAVCNNFNATNCPSGAILNFANPLTVSGNNFVFPDNLTISATPSSITFLYTGDINIQTGTVAKTFGDFIFSGTPGGLRSINLFTNNSGDKTFGNFTNTDYSSLNVYGTSTKNFHDLTLANGIWWMWPQHNLNGPTNIMGNFSVGNITNTNFNGVTTIGGTATYGYYLLFWHNNAITYHGAVTYTGTIFSCFYTHGDVTFNSTFTYAGPNSFGDYCSILFVGDAHAIYNGDVTCLDNLFMAYYTPYAPTVNGNFHYGINSLLMLTAGINCSGAPSNSTFTMGYSTTCQSSQYNYNFPEPNDLDNFDNYFQNITILAGSKLYLHTGTGTNTFRDIRVSIGSLIEFNNNGPNNILGNIYTTAPDVVNPPNCAGNAWFKVRSGPTQGILNLSISPQTVSHVMFENIKVNGIINANNGVDIVNNSNINFTFSATPKTYYWTGGIPGNPAVLGQSWGDRQNWSEVDGVIDPANACVPTPIDDVIFDANSFTGGSTAVNLSERVTCAKNITFLNVPPGVNWNAGNGVVDVFVYGDYTWHENVINNFAGTTHFCSSTPGRTLSTNVAGGTIPFAASIEFNSASGSWSLNNANIVSISNIAVQRGEFMANNNNISLYGNWGISDDPTAKFTCGTSTVDFNSPGHDAQFILVNKNTPGTFEFYNLNISRGAGSNDVVCLGLTGGYYTLIVQPYTTVKNVFTLNGGCLELNGYEMIITNPSPSATLRNSGYIRSERADNHSRVTWQIGSTAGTHLYPFGKDASVYLPFILNLASGNIGNITLATYQAPEDNSTQKPTWPETVTNMASVSRLNNSEYTIDRFWQITQAAGIDGNAQLTFTYASDEVTGTVVESLLMPERYRKADDSWTLPSNTSIVADATANQVTISGVTQFSPWTLASDDLPLPVDFLSVDAKEIENRVVDINWKTANEVNCDYYEIEHSTNGKNFAAIGKNVKADNRKNYSAIDNSPISGSNYYRVKMVEQGGKFVYSPIRNVNISDLDDAFNVFPNPAAKDNFNVSLKDGGMEEEVLVVLYNALGQEVYSKLLINEKGNMLTAISLSEDVVPGVYLVVGTTNNSIYKRKVIIK